MLLTIEGIYENGQVIFNVTPPLKEKVKVIVTFMDEVVENKVLQKRK
jgi:hypothetical protein